MGLPYSSRNGRTVKWVVLHAAEGARTKEDLYAFFNRNQNSSSHVGIDGRGVADWISRAFAAWTLLNGNPISVNAELCVFSRWTREQWLSTGWVDGCWNPRQIVRNAAAWAKRECEALGIPKRYIGTEGVRRGEAGIIIHWDYSKGTGDGDHWDTGSGFPWDVFFTDMAGAEEDDMYNEWDRKRDDHAAWRLKSFLDVVSPTHNGAGAPNPPERVQAAIDLNATKWRVHDLLHLNETGTADQIRDEELPFVKAFKQLVQDVAEIKAKLADGDSDPNP